MHTMHLIYAILLVFGLTSSQLASGGDLVPAEKVITTLHTQLLVAMKLPKNTPPLERIELIAPTINSNFDFSTIARIIMDKSWDALPKENKKTFVAVLRKLSVATYASHFSKFTGESFVVIKVQNKKKLTIVDTQLVPLEGLPVSLKYLLKKNNNKWQIINVIAQGVSDLALKRAEYAYILKNEGFESLISQLNAKITRLEKTN